MATADINGTTRELGDVPDQSLLGYLRGALGLTGAKPGCGEGECGACTVLVDGEAAFACQTQLSEVAGRSVLTIEGLAPGPDRLHPVQEALIAERASQCGYCTPAMALRGAALLSSHPHPDDLQIATAMDPNLCRCGCYTRIADALRRASAGADPTAARRAGPAPPECPPDPEPPLLPRPARPWDLSEPDDRDWEALLGDGLFVVWPGPEELPGVWPRRGGAWLHVAPSGVITAFSGKVDVGQDNRTAFRLLVAEELAAPPQQVRVVLGDTDVCPYDMGTFGSLSMPVAGEALRRVAAGARGALFALAGEAGPPVAARYGELVTGRRRLQVMTDEPPVIAPERWEIAGRDRARPSRRDAVTGERRFGSDLTRPGMAYGAVMRAPHPGARLRRAGPDPLSAGGARVVHDGDLIGAVAGDAVTARRLAASIPAEWDDPSPDITDVETHLRTHPASGEAWERALDLAEGDVEEAVAGAATLLSATYTTAYLAHVPLETRAAIAEWDDGRLTVWVSTQVPFGVRAEVAEALGLPERDVRVIVPPTGSGFGGRHRGVVAIEAARLARAAGRPVKVHWSRAEELQWGYVRPLAVIDVRAGLNTDGTIAAWDFLNVNAGAAGIVTPYRVAHWRLRYLPSESPIAQGSYRALAATANHFARESHIDDLARMVGSDPAAFRLAHLDDDRLATVLDATLQRLGGLGPGRGVAIGMEKHSRVATGAEIDIDPGGGIRVTRLVTTYECGAVVNPDAVRNQVEGATVMALGGAMFEALPLVGGRLAAPTLCGYRMPRFSDVPHLDVAILDRPEYPPAGAGETPVVAVAPAIANALCAATGERRRALPLLGPQ